MVYAQLGSPEVEFDSFWHVYNLLRDALDSEYLFQSSVGVFDEENTSRDSDIDQLPLHHLRGYEFGQDGIPAGLNEEEAEEQSMVSQKSLLHTCLLLRSQGRVLR